MNTSCNIIRDLLPLYHDGVCSEESKALVEAHLKNCAGCRDELRKYDEPDALTVNLKEKVVIRSVAEEWKKSKIRAFLKGALIVALAACIGCLIAYEIVGVHVSPNGMLVEPFALIPLAYLFALLSLILTVSLVVLRRKRMRCKSGAADRTRK